MSQHLTVGVGATLDEVALAVLGDASRAEELVEANRCQLAEALWLDPRERGRPRVFCRAPLKPGTRLVIPSRCGAVPDWTDKASHDPHQRPLSVYWTARLLEALYNVPGSAIGATSTVPCGLGKAGGTGECCDPTNDPYPSKPYLYLLADASKSPEQVGADFGRDDKGWIELRRANADDPRGFLKRDNGWCWWSDWRSGKVLRIPGNWEEQYFKPAALTQLRDGWGRSVKVEDVIAAAGSILTELPKRWENPAAMKMDAALPLLQDAVLSGNQVYDEQIAAAVVKRLTQP